MLQADSILFRSRLVRRILGALRDRHVLIAAPAGYGKSTLLRTIASHRPQCASLALTPADVDLTYLRGRITVALQPGSTLLLDDIHHLDGAQDALTWLATQLAAKQWRFVLAGRHLPPPLVQTSMLHLAGSDLAFSREECRAWFATDTAYEQTGGWPLALALARRGGAAFTDTRTNRAPLFEFLAATLLADLPATLVHFLQVTAAPLRVNQALADHLTGGSGDLLAEVLRRNLFLESVPGLAGWYRYHDLVRAFILERVPQPLATAAHQATVRWFAASGDLEAAVEQALAGSLADMAAPLVDALRPQVLSEQGRVWTFRRWCFALPQASWAAHVESFAELAGSLHNAGHRAEAWTCLDTVEAGLPTNAQAGRLRLAVVRAQCQFNEEDFVASQRTLAAVLPQPALDGSVRLAALRLQGKNLTGLGRLREAGRAYQQAIDFADAEGEERLGCFAAHNLATVVLTPLGDFQEARRLLTQIGPFFRRSPYLLGAHLLAWSELLMEEGDWDALAVILDEQAALAATLAENLDDNRRYILWTQAMLATARTQYDLAQQALDEALALPGADDLAALCLAQCQCWLYRRMGQPQAASAWAAEVLGATRTWPNHRAQLALERELSNLPGTMTACDDLRPLWQARRRAQLVRVRAMLAVRGWATGDPRWRRHARAALRALARPNFGRLLTARDPDLGAHFWSVVAAGGMAAEEAVPALQTLGGAGVVLAYWQAAEEHYFNALHRSTQGDPPPGAAPALANLTQLLVALGEQRAIPRLAEALTRTPGAEMTDLLRAALAALERLPPPSLEVQLMGEFTVRRDGIILPDDAWPRPIVKKLFQYFCLHRGQRLPRERILDDLWPNEDVATATATFYTVHSRLRSVLEPYLRARAPSRYFDVAGNIYQFDPHGRVWVDVEHFVATVRRILDMGEAAELPPVPAEAVRLLSTWKPLLPELPYEEWLVNPRERIHQHYIQGCLYLATSVLNRAQLREAMAWAARVLSEAPWVEEAYQVLMRGHARLDERSLALKIYGEAVAALQRELGVPPSPLTEWLAERLRRGEEI